jgi:hypothetical protein
MFDWLRSDERWRNLARHEIAGRPDGDVAALLARVDAAEKRHELRQTLLTFGVRAEMLIAGTAGHVPSLDDGHVAPHRPHRQGEMGSEEYRRVDAERRGQVSRTTIHGVELIEGSQQCHEVT